LIWPDEEFFANPHFCQSTLKTARKTCSICLVAMPNASGCAVPVYRFYIFEKNDHLSAPPKIYDLPSDAAALEAARTINGHAVEVWCHTRKVGRLDLRNRQLSEANPRLSRSSAINGALHP
jgi:hypothetical protein